MPKQIKGILIHKRYVERKEKPDRFIVSYGDSFTTLRILPGPEFKYDTEKSVLTRLKKNFLLWLPLQFVEGKE